MGTIEKVRRARAMVRARGLGYVLERRRRASLTRRLVSGRAGLEIGGPSGMFRAAGEWPAYPAAAALDNVNFAASTVWEGAITAGRTFQFSPDHEPGRQFIAEAGDLSIIADSSYDFLLSSHTLEHCANSVAVLREWMRVVRPGGAFLIALPHKAGTFDRRRPTTTLAHLIDDAARGIGEDDQSHVGEFLDLFDGGPGSIRDSQGVATHPAEWVDRCRENARHRVVHHHVFDTDLAVALADHVGLELLYAQLVPPQDILLAARRPTGPPDNRRFLASWRSRRRAPIGWPGSQIGGWWPTPD